MLWLHYRRRRVRRTDAQTLLIHSLKQKQPGHVYRDRDLDHVIRFRRPDRKPFQQQRKTLSERIDLTEFLGDQIIKGHAPL